MTVASNHSRIDYIGNGSTDAFAYDFRILADADLQVYLDGVLQALIEHYTVSGAGDPGGGTVTFVTAPPAFSRVALIRQVEITQGVEYPPAGAFPAEAHEAALDRLTMIAQQLTEQADRALAFPQTSTSKNKTVPEPLAQAVLRWKADLSGLENVASSNPFGGDITVLTSQGDLIQGGTDGVPENVPVGVEGSVLTVSSGKAAWRTLTAWLASLGALMTKGGLVTSTGGVVQQLPVGLDGTVLQADSTQPLGMKWAPTDSIRVVGEMVDYLGTTAPAGWVLASGRTIGDASSGATERANADTSGLFTLLWESFSNTELAIQDSAGAASTRGADAATDFAAHRRLPVPDLRGRVSAGKQDMGGTNAGRLTTVGTALGSAGGTESVVITVAQMPSHTHSVSDPGHVHGVSDPSHAHSITKQGTTAGSGAPGTSSGGGAGGIGFYTDFTNASGTGVAIAAAATGVSILATGLGQAHPNVQPTYITNKIIKL